MRPIPEVSGVYLRDWVYALEDENLFAEESFCDKWARSHLSAHAATLDSVGLTIREVESDFMQRVCVFFEQKIASGKLIAEVDY